jgi:hypothetical protein
VSFNAEGQYVGHTDDDGSTLVYRVWHENGDFEGQFDRQGDANECAEHSCDCCVIQTVEVLADGREFAI